MLLIMVEQLPKVIKRSLMIRRAAIKVNLHARAQAVPRPAQAPITRPSSS